MITKMSRLAGFSKVERDTVQNRVHAELRTALMLGRLEPGQVLTIQSLADTFGTSTLPAREALNRLVAERALEFQANGSARVPPLDRARLQDLRRSRKLIEGATAELAAAHLDDAQIEALQALMSPLPVSERGALGYPALEQNQEFHFALYRAAGSSTLLHAIESLWLQFGPYLRALVGMLTPAFGPGTEHHAMGIAALRRRDPAGIRAAVEADIDRVCDLIENSTLFDRPPERRRLWSEQVA
jgi:DNA-binding GntR family transcriptional regulator